MKLWQKYKRKLFTLSYLSLFIFTIIIYPRPTYAYLPSVWETFSSAGSSLLEKLGTATQFIFDPVLTVFGNALAAIATLVLVACQGVFNASVWMLNGLLTLSLSSSVLNTPTIATLWSLVRDFANIFLIFILLYISISTVLGLNGSNTAKMVVKLILVGLLMNFSLIITEVVIDTSNIVAIQFYNQITGGNDANDLGTIISASLSVPNIIASAPLLTDDKKTAYNTFLTRIGVSAILLIAAFVLAVGAGMFLVRNIKLMGIIMFSPLAFAAVILPQTGKWTTKWWEELTGNAFLAPVYLFMVYISLAVMATMFPPSQTPYSTIVEFLYGTDKVGSKEEADILRTLTGFGIGIGLLTSAAAVAAKMSGDAAKFGGKLTGLALGTTAGAVAATGRRFGGQLGQNLYERYASDTSTTGTTIRNVADTMRKGSWDFRNAPAVGAVVEGAAGQAGTTTQGGLYFNDAKASAGGRQKELAEIKTKTDAAEKERKDTVRKQELKKIKEELKTAPAKPANYDTLVQDEKDAIDKAADEAIQSKLKQLSQEEILELVGTNISDPDKQHLVRNLNRSSVQNLAEKGNLTDANKAELEIIVSANKTNNPGGYSYYKEGSEKKELMAKVDVAKKEIEAIITGKSSRSMSDFMSTLDKDVHMALPTETILEPDFAGNMDAQQISALMRSGKIKNRADREKVKFHVESHQAENPSGYNFINSNAGKKLFS